jgi:predicted small lipoprotein YifL
MRRKPPSLPSSVALAALCLALLAGCGQKGPLVRPGTHTAPVVVRAPQGAAATPATPEAAPAAPVTPAKNPDDDSSAAPRP